MQTGVVIRKVNTQHPGKIMFHGDQRTISVINGKNFYTHDVLNGIKLCQGKFSSSQAPELGAYWVHGDGLQLAMCIETDGKPVITIYELQPTSTPPLHVLSSFPTPSCFGPFSFSPVSFHASFGTGEGLTFFDVQSSELLYHHTVPQGFYHSQGQFSPNGDFFVCDVSEYELYVWQKTPTGYLHWTTLRSRSQFHQFSWSPTSSSIMCLGGGIQLLQLGKHPNPLPPNKDIHQNHLVAYAANGSHTAITSQHSTTVTVLNCLSGTSQQLIINTSIWDIKIVNNSLFIMGTHGLSRCDFETSGMVHNGHGPRSVDFCVMLPIDHNTQFKALSYDCSQVAFTRGTQLFLYNIRSGKSVYKYIDHEPMSIQFSLDGHQLWYEGDDNNYYFLEIEIDGGLSKVTKGSLEEGHILFNHSSPQGYSARRGSKWVRDSTGKKLLWLPPSWRPTPTCKVKWDHNFLALCHSHYPEPIVIKLQP